MAKHPRVPAKTPAKTPKGKPAKPLPAMRAPVALPTKKLPDKPVTA
jgi:hypothetical protein